MIKITTTVNGKETILNKKKIWTGILVMIILFGITLIPCIVSKLLYPQLDIKAGFTLRYVTFYISQVFIYWFFINGIIQKFYSPIYKFIKLKLFPM